MSVQMYDRAGVGIYMPLHGEWRGKGPQRDQAGAWRVQQAAAGWKQQCWPGGGGGDWHMGKVAGRCAV